MKHPRALMTAVITSALIAAGGVPAAQAGELAPSTTDRASNSQASTGSKTDAATPTSTSTPTTPAQTTSIPTNDADVHVLGVKWKGADPKPQVRYLRTGTWSQWESLDTEDSGPDANSAEGRRAAQTADPEHVSEPITVTDAQQVEVRSADPLAQSRDMTIQRTQTSVTAQDRSLAEGSASANTPGIHARAATASTNVPSLGAKIVTRKQWGAKEKLVKCKTERSNGVKGFYVHHTSGSNSYSKAQAPAIIRGYLAFHTQDRGWCDIGYNFLVDRFGTMYEGRAGSINEAVVGAHASGFNTNTLGLSVMGTFNSAAPPAAAQASAKRLIAWKANQYGFDPTGKMTLTSAGGSTTKYAAGKSATLNTVPGHRDTSYTDCPGDSFYKKLPTLRKGIKALQKSLPNWMAYKVGGAIGTYYKAHQNLGKPKSNEVKVTAPDGVYQDFEKGRVFWSKATGAHTVVGGIRTSYNAAGAQKKLGFPTADEFKLKYRSGAYAQQFQRGLVTWKSTAPKSGVLVGAMQTKWKTMGWERGPIGMPTNAEKCTLVRKGCYQSFERGSIHWTSKTGAHFTVNGPILDAWKAQKYENGKLGYPTSDTVTSGTTTRQTYEGGTITVTKGKKAVVTYKK